MLTISSLSLEYVRVAVAATNAGVAINPTTDTVQMAFVSSGATPVAGDWKSASWETDPAGPTYYARALVGPGGVIALTTGVYDVFAKISDNPEIPVRRSGPIQVT